MRRSFSRLLGITAAFAVSGCNSDRMLCNTNLIPAVSLTVRDSLTGQLVGSNSHLIVSAKQGDPCHPETVTLTALLQHH
jgi:hypothetical protein